MFSGYKVLSDYKILYNTGFSRLEIFALLSPQARVEGVYFVAVCNFLF